MPKIRIFLLLSSGSLLALSLVVACLRVGRYAPGENQPYQIGYPLGIGGALTIPVIFGYTLSETLTKRKNAKSKS